MARSLSTDVNTQLAARQRIPVLLFEFYLDSGTLYYARTNKNITFPVTTPPTGQLYTAKAIEIGGISQSAEGQIQGVTINVDDISGVFRTLLTKGENFQWKKVIVKRVYLDALTSALNYYEYFHGYINQINTVSKTIFEIAASVGTPLETRMINWNYQKPCGWRFGDGHCTIDLTNALYTKAGYATAGSTTYLEDYDLLIQVNDYWNHGIIKITIAPNVYIRKITDFIAASHRVIFDVALPEVVAVSHIYQIWKGCDQTFATCDGEGVNVWGPEIDNTIHFGGFLDIPTGPQKLEPALTSIEIYNRRFDGRAGQIARSFGG